ncbi:MAG: hypothetical protein AAGJ35_10150, partial [Myxococcota bacterium]
PNQTWLVGGSATGFFSRKKENLYFWNINTEKLVKTVPLDHGVTSLSFDTTGRKLVVGTRSEKATLLLWACE